VRYVSFEIGRHASWGRVEGDEIIDLGALEGAPVDLKAVISAGRLGMTGVSPRHARVSVRQGLWSSTLPKCCRSTTHTEAAAQETGFGPLVERIIGESRRQNPRHAKRPSLQSRSNRFLGIGC